MDETKPRRPNRLDAEKKAQFLEKVASGMRITSASKAVGIGRSTVWEHLNKDPEFMAAYKAAEQQVIELVEDALIQTCLKGNLGAIVFYLTNRASDRWADRRQPNVVTQTMSREEALALLKARGIDEVKE